MATVHILNKFANIPAGYFDSDNIAFIQNKITEILRQHFTANIIIDKNSILRTMQTVVEDRVESVPRMNQRVIMKLTREYKSYQNETRLRLQLEESYVRSQALIDPISKTLKFDSTAIKLRSTAITPLWGRYNKTGSNEGLVFHETF